MIPNPSSLQAPPSRARRARPDVYVRATQLALVFGVALVLFGVVSLALNEIRDLIPLLVIVTLGVLALRWAVGKVTPADDYELVVRVMLAGLLLRVGLTLVTHYNLPEWFFAPDQVTYRDVGWRVLQYHLGAIGRLPWQVQGTAEIGYFYWNAFLYYIFGLAPVAPKLANACVGTGSALLAYRLAGEMAGRGPARNALLLTMFFPSLVLWSALNLRDPIVLFLSLSLFLSVAQFRVKVNATSFFATALAAASLILFRDYVAVMVVFGLIGSSVISKGRGLPLNLAFGLALFGMAVFVYQRFGLGSEWIESMSLEALSQQRTDLSYGGTSFGPAQAVSTPLQGLAYLPRGLAFFFFSPFPWQIGSALSLMTLPEQIVWYGLMPSVAIGGMYLIRNRYHVFGPVLVFVIMTSCVYALVEGNAGTAYRHRSQVLIFFLIMSGVGLELLRLRRDAERRGSRRKRAVRGR